MNETIYHNSGKEFPRKFRKFGEICLSEINERIVVCGLCKCLYTTLPDFWKHQRVEHNLREYEDAEGNADYAEYQRSLNASNITIKDEKSNDAKSVENGTHMEPTMDDPLSSTMIQKYENTTQPFVNNIDAPILKKALKSSAEYKTKAQQKYAAKTNKKQDTQIPPEKIRQALQDAFDASPDNDNFDHFINFCCPECGKQFPGQPKLWKKHINTAHTFFSTTELNISLFKKFPDGGTIYKCDICHVQLNKPNLAPLRRHKLIHMPHKSYNCRLCNAELRHKSGILHHMRSVHRRGQKKLYSCKKCKKEFISAQHFQKHMQQHPRNFAEMSIKHENINDFADDAAEDLAEDLANEPILPDYVDNEADYDQNHYNKLSDEDDDNFDPSPFLITEMTEEDAWTKNDDETNQASFNGHTKDNSPTTEIIDEADDGYTGGLWLEDDFNALLQTQTIQPRKKKYKKKEKFQHIIITDPLKCEVCLEDIPNKLLYKKHLRKHGKNFDCRLCGVKISSIRALRRHYELNRCKAKGNNKKTARDKKIKIKYEGDNNKDKWNNDTDHWGENLQHNNEYHDNKDLPDKKMQHSYEDSEDEDEPDMYDVQIKEEPPVEIIDTDDEIE